MRKLSLVDLDDLAIGSAILGSGGGGDPFYPHLMARYAIEQSNGINLLDLSECLSDDLIVPVGIIGAPLAGNERILNGLEFNRMFEILERRLKKQIKAVMPFEIGGGTAFTPLIAGARLNLPVLDADLMGRAFPTAQMSTCHLFEIHTTPVFITDCVGNTAAIHTKGALEWERIGRMTSIAMGSSATFGLSPISGSQAKKCVIPKSISKSINIGKTHRLARAKGDEPLDSILKLCKGTFIGSGIIVDIDREISKGFLYGNVTIQNNKEKFELAFQNEFLAAKTNGSVAVTTPDIIVLLEQETDKPITTESLHYGIKVNLIALPAPEVWTSSAGLALVGPRCFGYNMEYKPVRSVS